MGRLRRLKQRVKNLEATRLEEIVSGLRQLPAYEYIRVPLGSKNPVPLKHVQDALSFKPGTQVTIHRPNILEEGYYPSTGTLVEYDDKRELWIVAVEGVLRSKLDATIRVELARLEPRTLQFTSRIQLARDW